MWKNWLALLERVTILEMPLEMPEWCSLAGAKDIKCVHNQRRLYVCICFWWRGVRNARTQPVGVPLLPLLFSCAVAPLAAARCLSIHIFFCIKYSYFCFCKIYEIKVSAAVRKLSVRRWWDLQKLKCNHNGIKSRAFSVLSVVARCFCMSLLLP